jgi:putative peptidoglycan lipid II flippase
VNYLIVFSGFAAQILLQFALQLLLARLFGASREMDAYGAGMTLPISLAAVLVGTLGPVLITHLGREEHRPAGPVAGLLVWGAGGGMLLLAGLGMVFAPHVMQALHPGFDAGKIEQSAELFRVLVWLLPANTLLGLLQCVLNARLNFTVPAVAGALGPLLTVLLVAWFGPVAGIAAVAWGTVAGAMLNVFVQLPWSARQLTLSGWNRAVPQLASLVRLAVPIFVTSLVLKADPLIDRYACSRLDDGSIAQLGYATRILTIFVMLASGTLSTVSFPRIARQGGRGTAFLAAEVNSALRTLTTLVLPAVAVLGCFSTPLVRDLFERGEFTPADTRVVADLLRVYAAMLIGASLGEVCVKTMYVLHDAIRPLLIGSGALLVGFVLKLWLVPEHGILVLAGVTTGVYLVAGIGQLAMVMRKLSGATSPARLAPEDASDVTSTEADGLSEADRPPAVISLGGLAGHACRCGIATLVAGGIGWVVLKTGMPLASVAGLVLGAAAYFGMLAILDRETRQHVRHGYDRLTQFISR